MGKVTVLFVDDEEAFRTLSIMRIKRIMKDQEFEFFEAGDGEAALALLKGGVKPSIIIIDYTMPKMNGIELLKRIDSDNPDLHNATRILISGQGWEELINEAQSLRCAFFEKGIDIKVFYEQLCQHMATKLGLS
jgi:CheY-like chemotaxis protein